MSLAMGPASSKAPIGLHSAPVLDDLGLDPSEQPRHARRSSGDGGPAALEPGEVLAGPGPEVPERPVEQVGGEEGLARGEDEAEPARGRPEVQLHDLASGQVAGIGGRVPLASARFGERLETVALGGPAGPSRGPGPRRVEAPVDPRQDPRAGAPRRHQEPDAADRVGLEGLVAHGDDHPVSRGPCPREGVDVARFEGAGERGGESLRRRAVRIAALEVERGARAEAGLRVRQAVDGDGAGHRGHEGEQAGPALLDAVRPIRLEQRHLGHVDGDGSPGQLLAPDRVEDAAPLEPVALVVDLPGRRGRRAPPTSCGP